MVDATIYNGEEIISSPEGDALKEATKNANDAAERANEAYYTTSQGRSAKYRFTSGGWKRILNIIRGSSGTINLGYGTGENYKSSQALAFDVCGFVKYPEDTNHKSAPILLKRYENSFGDDDAMATPKAKITKIRVGYPKSGTTFPNIPEGDEQDYSNSPVNCYVDVYMELDTSGLGARSCSFTMNYAGFADSNHCESILKETDATDTGIYGEELTYYTVSVEDMPYYLNSNTGCSSAANALKGSASGNQITLTDVSPIEHKMSATVYRNIVGDRITDDLIDTDVPNNSFYTVKDYSVGWMDNDPDFPRLSLTFTFEEGGFYGGEYDGGNPPNVEIGSTVWFGENNLFYATKEPYPNATLQTFGKNLLDIDAFGVFEQRDDGSYESTDKFTKSIAVNLPKGIYTYSGYVKSPTGKNYRLCFYYQDGTKEEYTPVKSNGEYIYQSITSNGKEIKSIGIRYGSSSVIEVKDLQLEVGETATEYEPYKGKTYTADESGNVKATSIYPTTILRANNDAFVVAEYNRDINKAIESDINAAIEDAEQNIEPIVEEIVNKSMQPRRITALGVDLSTTPCLYLGEIILVMNSALGWDAYICLNSTIGGGKYNWHKLN
jgi:hypothetical protein